MLLGTSISLPRAFPLHKKVFFLRSRKDIGTLYGYTYERGFPEAAQ